MMSGLVAYASSDEDDEPVIAEEDSISQKSSSSLGPRNNEVKTTVSESKVNGHATTQQNAKAVTSESAPGPDVPALGPAIGPRQPEEEQEISSSFEESEYLQPSAPLSPYSSNRALLRQYTIPTIPDYDIPNSPPGSPPQGTNAKFTKFVELKKQGVHFNEKLAKSSALKNPSLMQKLMDFSDINEIGQYATTLSKDLWDPTIFPEWAYKENLASRQRRMLKKIEEDRLKNPRTGIEFVPASNSADSSRSGTPGASAPSRNQKSTAERIMAGLDRRSNSPQIQSSLKRKSRFDT